MAALQQYLVPKTPAKSPWIDKNRAKQAESQPVSTNSSLNVDQAASPSSPGKDNLDSPVRKRVPPTRRLVRHVLRARARAVQALAEFFAELEHAPEGKRVQASAHLARLYGGFWDPPRDTDDQSIQESWREAREILAFLRARGARIASLQSQIAGDYWTTSRAVLSDADEEGETDYSSDVPVNAREKDELTWVAPMIQ